MVLSLFLSLIFLAPPSQTDPPPLAPNIDQLVGNLKQIQKDKADILAKEQAAIKSIQTEQKRINDLVNGAGIQPVPPPAPPDPFVAGVQKSFDACTEPNKADLATMLKLTLANALPYVDTDADTGTLFNRIDAGRKVAIKDTEILALRKSIGEGLGSIAGEKSQPFTSDLRAAMKAQIQKSIDALNALK